VGAQLKSKRQVDLGVRKVADMSDDRAAKRVEFHPAEYQQLIFIVHGGSRITRALVQLLAPVAKLLIIFYARVHRRGKFDSGA
jgi:hypothetical protein